MTESSAFRASLRGARKNFSLPARATAALLLAALTVAASAWFADRSLRASTATAENVSHALAVIEELQFLLANLTDAETGQRAYLLTGTENYLARYTGAQTAVPAEIAKLHALTADNPRQQTRLDALEPLVKDKFDELRETIALRRNGDPEGALGIVRSDRGKVAMDRIRGLIGELQKEERSLLAERQGDYDAAVRSSFRVTLLGTALLLALIVLTGWFLARGHREREIEVWLRKGLAGVSEQLLGERQLTAVCDKALRFLGRYLGVAIGTIYVAGSAGRYRREAAYAHGGTAFASPEFLAPGEGLVGQVIRDERALF